jgi:Trypsin-co-occurring domain 1
MSEPRYTPFKLPSGVVQVQSSLSPPAQGGIVEASGAADKAREAWNDGLDLVREVAEGVMAQLKEATKQAEQVSVEFGVNITGKTGIVLVEGTAAANLKVTVSWKGTG